MTRAARRRATANGISHQTAYEDVRAIRALMDEEEWTWAEAEDFYDDPANQLLCEKCGWLVGMICPECPGCGCYNGECTGWRHGEDMTDDEAAEEICDECGADVSLGSYDECRCDDRVS
jgi:hypothetical protein